VAAKSRSMSAAPARAKVLVETLSLDMGW
jgi:hypothetical protein